MGVKLTKKLSCHLNGTPINLPNSTPLMLAKRAIGVCDKHFKLWEKVYFDVPLINQIVNDLQTKGFSTFRGERP